MQDDKTNGGDQAPETTIIDPLEAKLEADYLDRKAWRDTMRETREKATKQLTITVSADTYGYLCAAGVVHDGTPEECAAAFLDDRVMDWSNDDYVLEG